MGSKRRIVLKDQEVQARKTQEVKGGIFPLLINVAGVFAAGAGIGAVLAPSPKGTLKGLTK